MHAVAVNGLCASPLMGRARAFAAAADAAAARPDAVISVVRYASPSAHEPEIVAVVSRGTAAPVDAAPVDAAPVDAAPIDADAAYTAAWLAVDTATVDLVPFALVADTVDAAVAECAAARRRVAETRTTSPAAYETACRVRDGVADAVYAVVRDAVADARAGYEPDADAVVVVPAERVDAFGVLQRAGVSVVRRGTPADAGAAWMASHNGAPAVGAVHVADAVAYACGARRPTPRRALTARGRLRGDA